MYFLICVTPSPWRTFWKMGLVRLKKILMMMLTRNSILILYSLHLSDTETERNKKSMPYIGKMIVMEFYYKSVCISAQGSYVNVSIGIFCVVNRVTVKASHPVPRSLHLTPSVIGNISNP